MTIVKYGIDNKRPSALKKEEKRIQNKNKRLLLACGASLFMLVFGLFFFISNSEKSIDAPTKKEPHNDALSVNNKKNNLSQTNPSDQQDVDLKNKDDEKHNLKRTEAILTDNSKLENLDPSDRADESNYIDKKYIQLSESNSHKMLIKDGGDITVPNYKKVNHKGKYIIVDNSPGNFGACDLLKESIYKIKDGYLTTKTPLPIYTKNSLHTKDKKDDDYILCNGQANPKLKFSELKVSDLGDAIGELNSPIDEETLLQIPQELIPSSDKTIQGDRIYLKHTNLQSVKILSLNHDQDFNPFQYIKIEDIFAVLKSKDVKDKNLPKTVLGVFEDKNIPVYIILANTLDEFLKATNNRFFTIFSNLKSLNMEHVLADNLFTKNGYNFAESGFFDVVILYHS